MLVLDALAVFPLGLVAGGVVLTQPPGTHGDAFNRALKGPRAAVTHFPSDTKQARSGKFSWRGVMLAGIGDVPMSRGAGMTC